MKVVITGGAGFIGSNFVHHWSQHHDGDEIVVIDALTYAGNRSNLFGVEDRIRFVHADIGDPSLVDELAGVGLIVNFAAESHNSLAVRDPGAFFRTNVMGTQTLLESARKANVERFHHVSTCEVYGDMALDDPGAFTEVSPYRPRTPYNASKAGADHAVRAYGETYGMAVTITVCSNNYGRYQFPEKVIPLFTTNALRDIPLPVYTSSSHRREWLHVDDHVRAIDLVLERGAIGETYNIGSGVEKSVDEIASVVLSTLGKDPSLRQTVPDRPGHDRRYLLDSSKIHRQLGWEPRVDFDEGVRQTIEWYAANPQWWQPLLDRVPVDEASDWAGPPSR